MFLKQFHIGSSTIAVAATLLAPGIAQAQTAPAQPAPQTAPPAKPADKPNDVVVTGTRSDVSSAPDRLSFSVANDLNAQTGSVADALRGVPGVEVDLEGRVTPM